MVRPRRFIYQFYFLFLKKITCLVILMSSVQVLYGTTYHTRFVLDSLEITFSHFVNMQLSDRPPVS